MQHVTMLTGHTRVTHRSEVRDDVIDAMMSWLVPGEHEIWQVPGGYRLTVPQCTAGWLGTVTQAMIPVASIGISLSEEQADIIWPAMVKLQRTIAEPLAARPKTPWVAVALLLTAPATMDWLSDFERCLAWVFAESSGHT